MTYSRFAEGLKAAGIGLDRKILAELAVNDETAFKSIVEQAKSALEGKSKSKAKKVGGIICRAFCEIAMAAGTAALQSEIGR